MGKTFVEDERPCDSCVNATRYGCVSWNCEYINRDEAIKAWREKHEMADRKDEPTISKMEQVDKDINVRSKDEPQTEDDLLLELMDAVERGEMSDAGANQAYVEYISKRVEESDTPQTERKSCKLELFDDDGVYIEPQMERSE